MSDKISIIVPVYDIKDYIERTVASICSQTYQNLEIILVDDGSKDGTSELLDMLAKKDNRICVIHKENGGVTSARFCGIKAAMGEWIGFVDGDDYIEPEMYERLLYNAQKYDADISHCGYQMVFQNRVDLYYGTGVLVEQDNLEGLKDLLEGAFIEPGLGNKLFRKSLLYSLLNKGVMDCNIKNNEDLLMNYYLFEESKKSIFTDQCYYHYMVRKGSAATAYINENKLRDPLKVLKILEKETEQNECLRQIVNGRIVGQLIGLSTLSLGNQKELVYPYRKAARSELRSKLPEILKSGRSNKQKIMALWTAICPASYRWIHMAYAKITGLDRKYSTE